MPKLDGVSATSLIRRFDHMTPIISMTSNSRPAEILKYYSSGMNDILPKPFTKDGLFDMLEVCINNPHLPLTHLHFQTLSFQQKHLMHLKVIQTMTKIPRSVGIPPISDQSFDRALVDQVTMTNVASSSASIDQSNPQASSSSSSSSSSSPLRLGEEPLLEASAA